MSKPASSKYAQHDILLESGTNELEVLVFSLRGQRYGVNVAKVREVIQAPGVTRMPQSHPAVVGVFRLRDSVTPLIDLQRCLKLGEADTSTGRIIIMEFNDVRVGFLVDSVEHIHRVSWKTITAIPEISGVREAPLTSVAHFGESLVLMLDFERLVFDIGGVDVFAQNAAGIKEKLTRADRRILLADDSHSIRTLIRTNLVNAGYSNVTLCIDGQEAWDMLEKCAAESGTPGFDILITDIEMPRVDGLHLTRKIKEHPQLRDLPVIIFSSLVSTDNEKKCKSVGANAQITKPQLGQLVDLIDGILEEETVAAV